MLLLFCIMLMGAKTMVLPSTLNWSVLKMVMFTAVVVHQ